MNDVLASIREGFASLSADATVKDEALKNITRWLSEDTFAAYRPQIEYVASQGNFELLLDSFYQVMPFGTGGRRGTVGIGTNRINPWTVAASAQGHSEYLIKNHPDAKERGVVITYDCRVFPQVSYFNDELPNPVRGITSRKLAEAACEVYAANGLPVKLFSSPRTTPELSFAIRYAHAVSGAMISASHNPREDNGKKVYAEDGGQLIPPFDQILVDTVNQIKEIKHLSFEEGKQKGLIVEVDKEIDDAYVAAVTSLSLSDARDAKIVFSPLHGCGITSVKPVLEQQKFDVNVDPATAELDGAFPNVKFNVPNPEVAEAFETGIAYANKIGADMVLASDPDADRLGLASREADGWRLFSGNELSSLLLDYAIRKRKEKGVLTPSNVAVKTNVTTTLITNIANEAGIEAVTDLLVGFKYIGNVIAQLEKEGRVTDFLGGFEESFGYLIGTYARDKDAAGAAMYACELASELKREGKTLGQHLDALYKKHGYVENALSSIVMKGASGKAKIDQIQETLRKNHPTQMGSFMVSETRDFWEGSEHVSATDTSSRNVLSFIFDASEKFASAKVTIRPSGTEPKTKVYIEVVAQALGDEASDEALAEQKEATKKVVAEIEESFMKVVYDILQINMPTYGLRLSSLLPLEAKIAYVEKVEPGLVKRREELDAGKISREDFDSGVQKLLEVFGKDPIEKISAAFEAQHGKKLKDFLA